MFSSQYMFSKRTKKNIYMIPALNWSNGKHYEPENRRINSWLIRVNVQSDVTVADARKLQMVQSNSPV